jgi:DNA-binding response OmpR family regulator
VARILVVEDDPVVARMLTLLFSLEGHDVEVASTADGAWRRLDGVPSDLVLLDVGLDEADGLDLLRELRARPSWEECRVVLVTARSTDHDLWRGWSAGADYYVTKPFDVDHLRGVSHRLLDGGPTPAAATSRS